jgi:hypothetical protein
MYIYHCNLISLKIIKYFTTLKYWQRSWVNSNIPFILNFFLWSAKFGGSITRYKQDWLQNGNLALISHGILPTDPYFQWIQLHGKKQCTFFFSEMQDSSSGIFPVYYSGTPALCLNPAVSGLKSLKLSSRPQMYFSIFFRYHARVFTYWCIWCIFMTHFCL